MAANTQENRIVKVTTPLGPDELLASSFVGREAISELFNFQVQVLAENRKTIAFDKLLVAPVTVELTQIKGPKRYFNGICQRVTEGKRGTDFTEYTLDLVPQAWILTRTIRSRHFQRLSVPDILKKVFIGLNIKFEISGTFLPRRYVAQYRESDFDFASRLMEEEGIFYYFQHSADGHKMVVANSTTSHADVPFQPQAIFEVAEGHVVEDLRVNRWSKTQEIRSGKYTTWDHCFEIPQQTLEATKVTRDTVTVGKVAHKLSVGGNANWEIYEYPGGFAEHFDGIDSGGGADPKQIENLFTDNKRIAALRMEQETLPSIVINGASNCGQFTAGHKFELQRHHNADGAYVLTSVEHSAANAQDYTSGGRMGGHYSNRFTCIPVALTYRPPQKTAKPIMTGIQLGFVVGPAGEKIFCDKYGRVKVQFHWDREGGENADSSCWLRVSNNWGGPGWGGNFVPHVGQEVMIGYEEGDPDRPMIVGRLYNAEQMPPLGLPGNKTKSILRDQGNNQIMMEGEGGTQQIIMSSPESGAFLCMGAKPPGIIPDASDQGTGSGAGAGSGGFVVPPRLDLSEVMTAEKLAGYDGPNHLGLPLPSTLASSSTGSFSVGSGVGGGDPPPPSTAPAPPAEESGVQMVTKGLIRFFVGGESIKEVLGNHHEVTIKDVFSTIMGNQSKLVKGHDRKHIFGFNIATTLGYKYEYIGGFKTEVIHGKTTSMLRGTKMEMIKGNTTKLHQGKEYKHEKSGKAEKSEDLKQMCKDLKQFKAAEKQIVKADKKLKIGGSLAHKAATMQFDAELTTLISEAKMKQEAGGGLFAKFQLRKEKVAAEAALKAAKAQIKASDIVLKGPCKLG